MVTTIILGIVSIGILIFMHELGHFLAARSSGIRVEVFSIGWGKGLVSFNWKGTRVQIGWIPFGGYCKMAGDSPRDQLTGSPEEYYSSSPFKRILVAFSGPLFNYILAFVFFSLVMIIGYQIKTYSNRILLAEGQQIAAVEGKTPARKAGLKDGDVIVEINGTRIRNWNDISEHIARNALQQVTMKARRDGKIIQVVLTPELEEKTGRGLIGIYPWVEPVVGGVEEGGPADRAGFEQGDRIVSVEGKSIQHHMDFYNAIEGRSGQKVQVTVLRNGQQKPLTLVPQKTEQYVTAGVVFRQHTYESKDYPLHIALAKGFTESAKAVKDTIRGIYFTVTGKISARTAVAGPARIVYLSGVIAREGVVYFLQVMSYISIAFFIINLVPFPPLDGSHIMISLYEVAARKKPNLEVIYKLQALGFILLIMVLIFVTVNDISSFLRR